jgi:hypothetical protein
MFFHRALGAVFQKDSIMSEIIGTSQLRCDLRNILKIGSVDSVPIQTAIQMGLLPVLERLARRAHELNDPELEEVLHSLGL